MRRNFGFQFKFQFVRIHCTVESSKVDSRHLSSYGNLLGPTQSSELPPGVCLFIIRLLSIRRPGLRSTVVMNGILKCKFLCVFVVHSYSSVED
jgi:hypothetical protein